MDRKNIPLPVVRRLPRYYRQLDDLVYDGVERVSSGKLAELMCLTASQVRQDFSSFGKLGQQGYGYNTRHLRDELADVIGIDKPRRIILFGLGHLGKALALHFEFARYNFSLDAIFIINPSSHDKSVNGVPVYHYDYLEEYLKDNSVDVAILATPRSVARAAASNLVDHGIRFLWNFTNIDLQLDPADAVVENIHFSDSLLILSHWMRENET